MRLLARVRELQAAEYKPIPVDRALDDMLLDGPDLIPLTGSQNVDSAGSGR